MGKRLFDIVGAACALVLLSPLMLGVALWIKFDSTGPMLYRQQRIGRGGQPFMIHKFRTMHHLAGGLPLTAVNDVRITRAGAFLRRTRVDELPQFFDVLRGRMSLVGPRPEVPRFVAHYPVELREQALAVRPGMTDPASLAYIDEDAMLAAAHDPERAYIENILPAKVARAAAYAQQATLASDLVVLWQTLKMLCRRVKPGSSAFDRDHG